MGFVKTRVKMVDKGSIYTRVKQIDMGSVCTWLKKVHMFWLCTWVKKVDVFHLHESKNVRIHPIWTKFRRVSMCLVWTTIKKIDFGLHVCQKCMYSKQVAFFYEFAPLYGDSVGVFLTPMRGRNITFQPIFSFLGVFLKKIFRDYSFSLFYIFFKTILIFAILNFDRFIFQPSRSLLK